MEIEQVETSLTKIIQTPKARALGNFREQPSLLPDKSELLRYQGHSPESY